MDSLPVSDLNLIIKIIHSYRIEPSLGKVESLTAHSCKHIREVLATYCSNLPNSGIYWVWKEKPMKVHTLTVMSKCVILPCCLLGIL